MILSVTSASIREAFAKELEPGESLVACAFGLRVPSKESVEKTLRRGLYVFGAIVLYFQRDKVFVGLTDRRLIILVLTERYAGVLERISIPLGAVRAAEHEKGSVYHELRVSASPTDARFLFFPAPMGVPDNAAQVLTMHAALAGRPAGASHAVVATPAVAGSAPGRRGCKRALLWGVGAVIVLVALLCGWGISDLVRAGSAADAARAAVAKNDLVTAEASFRRAIELSADAQRPALLHELAVVEVARNEVDLAVRSIRDARAIDPKYAPPAEVAAKLADVFRRIDDSK
ncbi:MAG: hypothetical protein K8T90_06365 [Planctomycetes bacterium]|nr:hypothetical protein [Planctomycetota bacterium]